MLSRLKTLLLAFTFCSVQAQTQDFAYKKYTWEKNPTIHKLSDNEKENNCAYIKEKLVFEYAYESSGDLVMYETRHVIIHFNTEKGIEELNKVYIPYSRILEEIDLKARTITANGKIIPLSKSSVKKVDDAGNGASYILFAMEGIDKGGEIEYLYTNKKSPSLYGSWNLQDNVTIRDVSVDVYSPSNLVFEGKGYNGFPSFVQDTTVKDKNYMHSKIDKISALFDEKYSAGDANKMRFEFQLAYNTARNNSHFYTWDNMGLDLYKALFQFTKQETKAVDKLISKLGINKLGSDELKIQALERFMKSNIANKETNEYVTIDKMLDLKYGGETCLQKFYIASAQALNIPLEVVVTCNRMDRKFDGDFPSWNNSQDYLIYYPSIGKYLSSSNYYSRLGFPPPQLTGNKGLFIKETQIGDLKTSVSKVKIIEAPAAGKSHSNINSLVSFDASSFTPIVNMKQEFTGYCAFYTQPAIPYMDDKQKKEYLDEMGQFIGKGVTVKSINMTGGEPNDILAVPLTVDCVVEAPQLIENAGGKYIFKVGDLIGPQEEMYQEKKRLTDGDIYYTHSFNRTLEIKIPAGYKIKNLNDIKIDKKCDIGGKIAADFISTYTMEGNTLKIKVVEEYNALNYPKEYFEQFRSVINAAADFNKIALIFEKI
jgi:3-deoxy-D-manno-octulosonate 8-phosphate phosphatase KdsC-like HAD superfamily phosphatase